MNISKEILPLLRRHAGEVLHYLNVAVTAEGFQITHECDRLSDLAFTESGIEIDCGESTDCIRIQNSAIQDMDIFDDERGATYIIRADAWTAVFKFAWMLQPVV